MKTTLAVVLAATLLCGTGFASAVLAADPPELMMVDEPVTDWGGFYAKVYGGATAPNVLLWGGDEYDVDQGWIGGAALGISLGNGLSIELDATASSALYTGQDNYVNGATLMANAVFEVPVADMLGVYGGIGVGGVFVEYNAEITDPAFTATGTALGGQILVGVSFDLTDNVSVFGEARYQSAFGDVSVTDDGGYGTYDMGFARTAVLVGIKISN
jgi:opacity protein-like surface antigen